MLCLGGLILKSKSFNPKTILFHSKDFTEVLIYNEEYPTKHIPTGFVSVTISGVLWGMSANLTGLEYMITIYKYSTVSNNSKLTIFNVGKHHYLRLKVTHYFN